MAFTTSYIIAALLLSFFGVTIAECYSNGTNWGDIVDGDIKDAIKDFCLDHHGATFTEGGQAKGCVDTSKGQNRASLNITIQFVSILDASKAVNFTADSCEGVLMVAKDLCEHGGQGLIVSHMPVVASPTMKARDDGHKKLDQRGLMANIQGRGSSVSPLTAEASIILQNSTTTTNQRAGTPETSPFFTSTATCKDTMKMNAKVPESVKITTTLPITLTITVAPHVGSTSTITTTTTSNAISTTTKPTITTSTTTTVTSTAMNAFFTAKIMMDPNDCGCAHC